MTVIPTSSEHDHSTKQELSYQPTLHQLRCYRVKRPSKTLNCIMNAGRCCMVVLLLLHSQDHTDVPEYQELLDFLNLRAQAAEASAEKKHVSKRVNSMVISTMPTSNCISCGLEKHQLYSCAKFRSLSRASILTPQCDFITRCENILHF